MRGQFHDRLLGQLHQRAIVIILGWLPVGTIDLPPLPYGIGAIAILNRDLLARLILGADIAARDSDVGILTQRHQDALVRDLGRFLDQRPLLAGFVAKICLGLNEASCGHDYAASVTNCWKAVSPLV